MASDFVQSNTLSNNHFLIIYLQIAIYFIFLLITSFFLYKEQIDKRSIGLKKLNTLPSKGMIMYLLLSFIIGYKIYSINMSLGEVNLLIIISMIIKMLFVGIVEEVLSRGLYYYLFAGKKILHFVVISSLIFSLLHIPANIDAVFPQLYLALINTFLLGVILSLILVVEESIYPCILFHTLFNIVTIFSQNKIDQFLISLFLYILNIMYLLYRVKLRGKKVI